MTSSPAPQRRRGKADRPKARVMYLHSETPNYSEQICRERIRFRKLGSPVLVLPCASTKSARKRLAFERLTFEGKVEAVAKCVCATNRDNWSNLQYGTQNDYRRCARAILHLLGEGEERK